MSDNRIIVALDFASAQEALALVQRLDPDRCAVKVGKELFTREGPGVVHELGKRGFPVFLDLKYHDIPNTVAGACRAAGELGAWMLNVHASGGSAMMRAARAALEHLSPRPLLVAVTVLTSLDGSDLDEVGLSGPPDAAVLRLARLAQAAGLDGVVCSPREIVSLRASLGPDFLLVTPGIRPAGAATEDQKRVMTPAQAVREGASHLVIGRPITGAARPLDALAAIEGEIARER